MIIRSLILIARRTGNIPRTSSSSTFFGIRFIFDVIQKTKPLLVPNIFLWKVQSNKRQQNNPNIKVVAWFREVFAGHGKNFCQLHHEIKDQKYCHNEPKYWLTKDKNDNAIL